MTDETDTVTLIQTEYQESGIGEARQPPAAMTIWPPHMVAYVRRLLPPIEEVQTSLGGGPDAKLPAIFIHLCLLRIEQLELAQREAEMRAAPAVAKALEQVEP